MRSLFLTKRSLQAAIFAVCGVAFGLAWPGCGFTFPPEDEESPPFDPSQANYVGAPTCLACHPQLSTLHERHGHSQALKIIEGTAPVYPDVGANVGVPMPPQGFSWFDIDFVIGGYTKGARFVSDEGFVLTDGTAGVHTQYNLASSAIQTPAEYVAFRPDQTTPLPLSFERFRYRTTGPQSLEENGGRRQGNRPGIEGTWQEAGVQCESCHGPGSLHLPNPTANNILVDSSPDACAECHSGPDGDATRIAVEDLFMVGNQQYAELQASPHAGFSCTTCHDPHVSVLYDRSQAIRNECVTCHPDVNMAFHENTTFTWNGYTETVTCTSCHMPYAVKNAASTEIDLALDITVRFGDTQSHIMNINPEAESPLDMFNEDLTAMALDEQGQAAITTCYICQRCHHGLGNAFALTLRDACSLGKGIHGDLVEQVTGAGTPSP